MAYRNVAIRLEQNGAVLEAGTGFDDVKIYAAEGFTGLDFDFVMKNNPQTPNAVVNAKKPLPREIKLKAFLSGGYRQILNGFFTPYVKGKLSVTWENASRWIEYYSYPVKIIQETVYRPVKAEIKLICPEPFWNDAEDYAIDMSARRNLLAFPYVELSRGVISDYRLFGSSVAIFNPGDVPAGIAARFKASGAVANPALTLDGGKFLRAVTAMAAGDEIIFNTNPDDVSVTQNGADILHKTDEASEFFQIPPGASVLSYGADEGTSNLRVLVSYVPQYIGI
jgi:hypothetical protein